MPFDANKLYCSEILAILLQNNDSKCVSVNGLCLLNDDNLSSTFLSPLCSLQQTLDALSPFSFPFILCLHSFVVFSFLCLFIHFFPTSLVLFSFFLFSFNLTSVPPSFVCPISLSFYHHSWHCLIYSCRLFSQ